MKALLAIDSFKGCVSSLQANRAAADGVVASGCGADTLTVPVSDGGEGWIEAFREAMGGHLVEVDTFDPMMRRIKACYLMLNDTAVVEIAQASGLTLLKKEERNPLRATSYGTGILVADAIKKGARRLIVGLGGSATSDVGIGMLKAVVDVLAPQQRWDDIALLHDLDVTIACDVNNPLCGPMGAAHVFGPQKGANPEMVAVLDERAHRFALHSSKHFGFDRSETPGAGAAGGLGYAFMQYFGARQQSGIDLLLDTIRFDDMLEAADVVVTGEGASDAQTLMGKLPVGILRRCQRHGVPVALIAGQVKDRQQLLDAGFSMVRCINPEGADMHDAMKPVVALGRIKQTVMDITRAMLSNPSIPPSHAHA